MRTFGQVYRDTAANLAAENYTPAKGDIIIETDTGYQKVGDGTTAYNSLAYSYGKKYKSYRALLTQSSTTAPAATVLENELGGTVVLARTSAGLYTLTLAGAFTASKTSVSFGAPASPLNLLGGVRTSADVVTITTELIALTSTDPTGLAVADGLLTGTLIEIRVDQ